MQFAAEMSEFLKTSELTESKAFVGSFVKEIVVKPGRAAIIYWIPTPDHSPIGGAEAAEIALNGRVMNSVRHCGPEEARTPRKDRYGEDHRAPNHIPKTVLSTVHLGPLAGDRTTRLPLNYFPSQLPSSPTDHE